MKASSDRACKGGSFEEISATPTKLLALEPLNPRVRTVIFGVLGCWDCTLRFITGLHGMVLLVRTSEKPLPPRF